MRIALAHHQRYFCRVPVCEAQDLLSRSTAVLRLGTPDSSRGTLAISVQKVRAPFVYATTCSQPLWNHQKMLELYPDVFHEWIAYHLLRGFGQVLPRVSCIQGAHCALCPGCGKSRLFSTTSSHGPQGPEFCTPNAIWN